MFFERRDLREDIRVKRISCESILVNLENPIESIDSWRISLHGKRYIILRKKREKGKRRKMVFNYVDFIARIIRFR